MTYSKHSLPRAYLAQNAKPLFLAPVPRLASRGALPALADALLWSLACASCFGLGYCLALALARHLGGA